MRKSFILFFLLYLLSTGISKSQYCCPDLIDIEVSSNEGTCTWTMRFQKPNLCCDLLYKRSDDTQGYYFDVPNGGFQFTISKMGAPSLAGTTLTFIFYSKIDKEPVCTTNVTLPPCIEENLSCCEMINMYTIKTSDDPCCYEMYVEFDPDYEDEGCQQIHGILKHWESMVTQDEGWEEVIPYQLEPINFDFSFTECYDQYVVVEYWPIVGDNGDPELTDCSKIFSYDCGSVIPDEPGGSGASRIKSAEESIKGAEPAGQILHTYNIPNPADDATTIFYELSEKININIEVYNSVGIKVLDVFNGQGEGGINSTILNTTDLSDGKYFIKISTVDEVKTLPITILK